MSINTTAVLPVTRHPLSDKEQREQWRPAEECRCPRCRGSACRVTRQPLDRLISIVYPVYRFRCRTFGCEWQGLIASRRTSSQQGPVGWV